MRPEHVCYVQFLLPKPVLWTELIFSSTRWNDSLEKRLHCKFHKSKCSVTIALARYCLHSKYFEYTLLFIHEVIDTKGTLASPSTPYTIPGNVIKWQQTSIIALSHSYRTFWIRQWRLCVFFLSQTAEERKLSSTSWMGANASPRSTSDTNNQLPGPASKQHAHLCICDMMRSRCAPLAWASGSSLSSS